LARWVERIVLTLVGALVGAGLVAGAEARTAVGAAGGHPPALFRLIVAEFGVLVPLALVVGAAVAAASIFLEPERPLLPSERIALVRSESVLARSRIAALAPLTILAATAWVVAVAQVGRSLLSRAAPMAAGFALAVGSLGLLLALGALVLAALAPLRRALAVAASRWPRAIDPVTTGALALGVAVAVFVAGMALGDTGGEGPTPLAILGVLRRHELDLRPVVDLIAVVACAWLAPIAGAARHPHAARAAAGLAAVAVGLAVTASQAVALERETGLAQVIDSYAPLGRIALAIDRKATDRDGDGASPYFGGGDCNDSDPSVSPYAVDVPGNGIDEDCSGADAPLPASPPPAVATAGRTPPKVDRDLNLILITVDTLRASEMGFLGYDKPTTPNLDALAADSVVFDRAYAMASYTGKALAPMLIGKYPSETLRDGGHFTKYFQGNTLLAERLHAAGLFTMGAASQWYFRETWGLTQGCDVFDLSALPSSGQTDTDTNTTSPQLTDAAIRLLEENARSRRFFLWVHYFDPHAQYVPHDGAPDFADPSKPSGWRTRALYDGEIWFTDRAIGRLLAYAKSKPWASQTAIVVTSDHGEAMGEHGIAFQHGFEVWEPLVRVPLIVHVPGAAPHHVPVKRSVIDLVPTILDLLNVPPPPPGELSGQSAMDDVMAREGGDFEERDVYLDMPDGPYTHLRRALIHGTTPGMKLIHFGGRHYQLYDLAADPGELDDLASDPDRLRPMAEALQAKRATLHEVYVKPDAPAVP
jgi:arylsulfatase A-like enzyme